MKYFYIRVGLQAKDAFFGDINRIRSRSSNLMDDFPGKILLEAQRRYGKRLARENVDKLSLFSGWHLSSANRRYHYTLRAYNPAGWMAVTIEMEAAYQGKVFTYDAQDWSRWTVHSGGLRAKHFFQLGHHTEMLLQCSGSCTISLGAGFRMIFKFSKGRCFLDYAFTTRLLFLKP
ncbi:hypothetical protein IW261DRAFT_1597278 [Armillaria novae-zelandiae]|uniref:Uncharacterized protein n=1 Tax=Armillaria novae-zelandiae TaxID=153914 RepID=A0AA39U654_9AGAR|nr:hypothetical protein IW261DRAFT_1597278 [Armillaria novae-zelandiae]